MCKLLESAFYLLLSLKFSFKLVTFSTSYAKNNSGCFFLNTVYYYVILHKSFRRV